METTFQSVDAEGAAKEIGTVRLTGGTLEFEGFEDQKFVDVLKRGFELDGQGYHPSDPEAFIKALPLRYCGYRLYATEVTS